MNRNRIRLRGVCIVCRKDVVWSGVAWRRPGQWGRRHVCPIERPTCGAWMPMARERCVRRPGHWRDDHRSAYALNNERIARAARGAA